MTAESEDESSKRIREMVARYRAMSEHWRRLIEEVAGQDVPRSEEWRATAQVLSVKAYEHIRSAEFLFGPPSSFFDPSQQRSTHDVASISLLLRGALESYLVFHHLYADRDESTSRHRVQVWKYAGLCDRYRQYEYANTINRTRLDQEKVMMDSLAEQFTAHDEFLALPKKQQKEILKGNWRVGLSWSEMAQNAGFGKNYFDAIYSQACGFSHSSYDSALKISSLRGPGRSAQGLPVVLADLMLASAIAALFIRDTTKVLWAKTPIPPTTLAAKNFTCWVIGHLMNPEIPEPPAHVLYEGLPQHLRPPIQGTDS